MATRSAIALLTLSLASSAHAQSEGPKSDSDSPKWTLQVDPLTAALGYAHVQVEYALSEHYSIYVGPHLRFYNNLIGEKEDFDSVGIESAFRYFWRGGAPAGPWVQVRGVASYLSSEETSEAGGYFGVVGGYSWIFSDRWVAALGLGVQYIHMRVGDLGPKGVLPAAHTAVGIAF